MNTFPTRTSPRRLALVFESPAGAHGYLLDSLLASAGIDRAACFIGNLSPRQGLKFNSPEVQTSIAELQDNLAKFEPHFILGLDRFGTVLRWLSGEKRAIDSWRGSLFTSTTGIKTLCTYHPQRLTMEHGLTGVVRFDVQKVAREMRTDTLTIPVDRIEIDLSCSELIARMDAIVANSTPTACDIEGFAHAISCIGFATGPNDAFVVPFIKHDNTSYWSEEEEILLWQAVQRVLEAANVPKICHNGLYELFCLVWAYGIVIVNLADDTMVLHFELYAEMEKSLGFCTSIYTSHPFYKSERKSTDDRALLLYNGKDCCRTYGIWQVMTPKLQARQREHYEFNISLLIPLAYMSLRGIRYDSAAAARRLAEVQQQIYEKQDEINREASASRPELAEFYEAIQELQMEETRLEENRLANGDVFNLTRITTQLQTGQNGDDSQRTSSTSGISKLIPIFARAFCRARCTESREVEETTWQPMRWNGKKWVRDGKRVKEDPIESWLAPKGFDKTQNPNNALTTCYEPITKIVLRNVPVEIKTFKDVQRFAKDSCATDCKKAIQLCNEYKHSKDGPSLRGQLTTLLDIHVNTDSTNEGGDSQWYLYEHCKLEVQYKRKKNQVTGATKVTVTTDDEAIIKAYIASGKSDDTRDKRALTFLKMRKLSTESSTLKAGNDADGRIRCSYNLVGTDTHRLACYESNTGSGYNLQTVTKSHRDLFLADDDCWLCQRDLSGADGWTVAAYSAMLGDRTMLDDYLAKLKPAKIVVLMFNGGGTSINALSRDELRAQCKDIDEDTHWQYFAMKRVQHGSSYWMGGKTMSNQILTDSFKKDGNPIYLAPKDCETIQTTCFFARYPGIKRTHEWMTREIKEKGMLVASNGFQRKFYGRKDDNGTVRKALGHLPQVYTTYATTLATLRLWQDPTNRNEDGSLKVEPLHTVHDSLITQWKKADTDYAKAKMKDWFHNELRIADTTLVIPASGSYGKDWLNQEFEL